MEELDKKNLKKTLKKSRFHSIFPFFTNSLGYKKIFFLLKYSPIIDQLKKVINLQEIFPFLWRKIDIFLKKSVFFAFFSQNRVYRQELWTKKYFFSADYYSLKCGLSESSVRKFGWNPAFWFLSGFKGVQKGTSPWWILSNQLRNIIKLSELLKYVILIRFLQFLKNFVKTFSITVLIFGIFDV